MVFPGSPIKHYYHNLVFSNTNQISFQLNAALGSFAKAIKIGFFIS